MDSLLSVFEKETEACAIYANADDIVTTARESSRKVIEERQNSALGVVYT